MTGTSVLNRALKLSVGEGGARLIGVATFALLARALGVSDFGTFSFALSTALLLGVLVDMGQNVHLGRVVARDSETGATAFPRVVLNKLVLAAGVLLAVWLVLPVFGFNAEERAMVVIMGMWAASLSILDSLRAIARATYHVWHDATVNTLESLGRLVAVLLAWALGASLIGYGIAFVIEASLAAVLFYSLLRRRVRIGSRLTDFVRHKTFLRESATVGVVALATAGFYRIDQILVQGIAGPAENGLYGAAARIIFTATAASVLVVMAAYPEMASSASQPREYVGALRRALGLAVGASTAVALVLLVFAGPIVRLLLGAEFAGAVPLVRVMSGVVIFNSFAVVGLYSASSLGRERRSLVVVVVMLCLSVLAALVVIPRYGALGAAWVSTLGELGLAAGLMVVSMDMIRRILPEWRESRWRTGGGA
jgi:O-antigen/teichoic acid export membrane protein